MAPGDGELGGAVSRKRGRAAEGGSYNVTCAVGLELHSRIDDFKSNKLQTSTSRDLGVPRYNGLVTFYVLQMLPFSRLSKLDKVRRIWRICNVSFIVKVKVTLIIFYFFSCAEWHREIVYVWDLSIFTSSKLFEHTLEVMPVEHTDVWE